ncbi:Alpha/Beta hydrolase fold containing protein [Cryptosporidium felis]|nr:Alpha/Beta hydrolase fold containing protein [Cryptosporidium felis]
MNPLKGIIFTILVNLILSSACSASHSTSCSRKSSPPEISPVKEEKSRPFEPNVSVKNHYRNYIPGEVFYSTSKDRIKTSVKLVFYGDYISSDYNYINIGPKYGPRVIGTCGHFVHKSIPPKYTILVSFGGLDSYYCSLESVKFFVKFVNYISSIYGLEFVNQTQFIFIDWFGLIFNDDGQYIFSSKMVRYWMNSPSKFDVVTPAVSSTAFINKLLRVGIIPSMLDAAAYGICVGATNTLLTSLLLKSDIKVVVLNGSAFLGRKSIKKIVNNTLKRAVSTKYFVLGGTNDSLFNHKRHSKRLSEFISKYADFVRYIKLDADHYEMITDHFYTSIKILASILLGKEYTISHFENKHYREVPKVFSRNNWYRYVMYEPKSE